MTYTRLAVLFGAALFALPAVSNAACPTPAASGTSQQLAQVTQPRNGAGQIIDQGGIPIPGQSSQGAADDRVKTTASNKAQGAADDRANPAGKAQGASAEVACK